ncbi:MAG TPA: beta-ketoacyl-ACP synthase II [Nitrospirota bacterium]|nr:beta-ketoacyl-ACP synthase II [Nitrospirota bacterium]
MGGSPIDAHRPKNSRRVVVTGMAAITPMATGIEQSWSALQRGVSPIKLVTRFDTSRMRTRVGGELADFSATDFMDKRTANRYDRFIVLALAASRMAAEDAKLGRKGPAADRIGVMLGNCLGGATLTEQSFRYMSEGRAGRISPFFIPGIIGSSSPGVVAIALGAKGPSLAVNTACASGSDALGQGLKLIRSGDADAVVAGGSEAPITELLYYGFSAMRATSARNREPEKASRPFDKDRDGFVPAEGAGVLVLEGLESALHRGVPIYAEVAGYGASCDAYHITSPDPQATGAVAAIRAALRDAGIQPAEVDHVNAHGTSTQLNDLVETRALKAVFGARARELPVSSNKSVCGHTIAAAGALEAVFSVLSIRDGVVPPTLNYEVPDPELDLDYVPNRARKEEIATVLSNSFGFGGANACLVFRKWNG